jgi:hypothetical protein
MFAGDLNWAGRTHRHGLIELPDRESSAEGGQQGMAVFHLGRAAPVRAMIRLTGQTLSYGYWSLFQKLSHSTQSRKREMGKRF